MELSVLNTCALMGLQAPLVRTEVHIASGLPSFTIVGLPDTGVRESRERVRSALQTSGFEFPLGRIIANLAPADLPKESGRFDLPIAVGILLATGQIKLSKQQLTQWLPHLYFVGELSLSGALVPIQAPLILALSIYRHDPQAVLILPKESASSAACVKGLTVYGMACLNEVVDFLNQSLQLEPAQAQWVDNDASKEPCLSDIRGQPFACKLLEIAASGGHGMMLIGSPGVGKSMLAQRLPSILPDLTQLQQLDVMAIHSLSRHAHAGPQRIPYRAPHHSASMAALVGGGTIPRPGEISLAHHGVLFLDELPEFHRSVLEALREPLETGEICIARANRSHVFPARFQFIAAANPCPCGYFGHPTKVCRCTPERRLNYQSKFSGPLLDRVDIFYHVLPLSEAWLDEKPADTSAVVKERVSQCRQNQYDRQGKLNAQLTASELDVHCVLEEKGKDLLTKGIKKYAWSARVTHRMIRVARTLADMEQSESILEHHLAQAMSCRQQSLEL